jgi:1-acyl-sn-glycerol-3-phosphate acyltransferase
MTPADHHTALRYALEAVSGHPLGALSRMTVTGLENVPPSGPLILVGNHRSVLDGNVLAWAVHAVRRPRFLGKAELFRNPLLRWLFTTGGAIPVDRTGDVTAAMRAAISVLKAGGSLVMYPEGRRLKRHEDRIPAKSGVGFLAAASGASVVPARLRGVEGFPFSRIEVTFGRPLPPPPPGKDAARDFAQAVMDAVYTL